MAEYIELKAAVELAMQYCPDDDGTCSKADKAIRELLDELENLPSIQLDMPLIRCKECKFRENDDFCTGRGFPYQLVPDDGFCDKGERKE